jgi:hypothetical protein
MRKLFITAVLFLSAHFLFAQVNDSTDCLQYHRGKFSYTDSLGNLVLVDRKKKYQYEKNQVTKVKTQDRIKWISPCQYELTLVSTNSKSLRKYKYTVTTTNISKPLGEAGYEYTCNCNNPAVPKLTGLMKKIKK